MNFYLLAIEFLLRVFRPSPEAHVSLFTIANREPSSQAHVAFVSLSGLSECRCVDKSCGCPVSLTFILQSQQIIILVTLYAQAKKADLNKAEENEPRKISGEIRSSLGTGKS